MVAGQKISSNFVARKDVVTKMAGSSTFVVPTTKRFSTELLTGRAITITALNKAHAAIENK